MAIIYCARSRTSGKPYVGMTIRALSVRWDQHCKDALVRGYETHMARAVRKYGPDDFELVILEVCLDSLWSIRERYWIAKLDSKNAGYNLTDGGEGLFGYRHSKKSRQKMSIAAKGRVFSKIHRQRLSKARKGKPSPMKGITGEQNPHFGRKRSLETCKNISESKKKGVEQWTLDGKFVRYHSSLQEAADVVSPKKCRSSICRCLAGKAKHAHGYVWRRGESDV